MASEPAEREPLPTIWRVPDELWAEIEPVITELDPPNRVGPKRTPAREILDAIIYRGRTGCQWNHLPKEFPDDSTVHRFFQRWREAGVFRRVWAVLIERCEELDGVEWEWQAADGALGQARKGGTMSGRTQPTARRVACSAPSWSRATVGRSQRWWRLPMCPTIAC
jgi:putative transposase